MHGVTRDKITNGGVKKRGVPGGFTKLNKGGGEVKKFPNKGNNWGKMTTPGEELWL